MSEQTINGHRIAIGKERIQPTDRFAFVGYCYSCKAEVAMETDGSSFADEYAAKAVKSAVFDHCSEPIPAPL